MKRDRQADLERLASYPEQLLVINMHLARPFSALFMARNYRMIRSLFEARASQVISCKLI